MMQPTKIIFLSHVIYLLSHHKSYTRYTIILTCICRKEHRCSVENFNYCKFVHIPRRTIGLIRNFHVVKIDLIIIDAALPNYRNRVIILFSLTWLLPGNDKNEALASLFVLFLMGGCYGWNKNPYLEKSSLKWKN